LQVKPLEIKDCLRPIPGGKAAYEAEHKIRNDLPAHQLLASCSGADYYQSRIAPLKKKARVLFEGERGIASARPHAFADQVQTASIGERDLTMKTRMLAFVIEVSGWMPSLSQ
jgi:hypothetical protein